MYKVAIVGIGPRGLVVLERILAHAKLSQQLRIELSLFDKADPGPGCHTTSQLPDLKMNTAAGQITQFPLYASGDLVERIKGPDFGEWVALKSGEKTEPRPHPFCESYLSRALYGAYLQYSYDYLLSHAPPNVAVHFTKATITGASLKDRKWILYSGYQEFGHFDFLHISTGHNLPHSATNNPDSCSPKRIDNPFPISEMLSGISAPATVAIEGLGLTTFDIISELTIGRGGHFEPTAYGSNQLRYVPSGREPKILAFSRSGLPLQARPVNQKKPTSHHEVKHFTEEVARKLYQSRPVDFEKQVLPLLIKDMEDAYNNSLMLNAKMVGIRKLTNSFDDKYVTSGNQDSGFSWERLKNPIPASSLSSQTHFAEFLITYLQRDIDEASRGNIKSPSKAACDVMRDLRERIAMVVDFNGLSGKSHQWFNTDFLPLLKRLSVGPPRERIAQMIALIKAGLLTMDFGPNTKCEPMAEGWLVKSALWPDYFRKADILVKARVPTDLAINNNELINSLLKQGLARLHTNEHYVTGGIEVTRTMNLVSAEGKIMTNIWATGVVTEGVRFYTFVLCRPGAPSRFEEDAETAVKTMFAQIHHNESKTKRVSIPKGYLPFLVNE